MAALSQDQNELREHYLITLAEATFPLKEKAEDLEVTLELLIDAAGYPLPWSAKGTRPP